MRRRCRRFAVAVLISATIVAPSAAYSLQQGDPERELDEARALYREGRFDQAIPKLLSVVSQLKELRDLQRGKLRMADACLLLGLSYFALRDESAVLENFRQVVVLDPDRTLDPEIFSPRVVSLFEQVRTETLAHAKEDRGPQPAQPDVGGSSAAQPPPKAARGLLPLDVGMKLRLGFSRSTQSVEGHLVALNDNTFRLVNDENRNLAFPRALVTKVSVSRGKKNHLIQGVIAGAALGALAGVLETPAGPGCQTGDCWTRGENVGYGTLGMSLVGALVGALYRSDRWVEVPLDRLTNTPPEPTTRHQPQR